MKTQITKQHNDTISISLTRKVSSLRSLVIGAAVVLATLGYANAQTGGTWTALKTSFPGGYPEQSLLLTDGSVLVQSGSNYADWYKLTPDSTGHYVNGTWKKLASIPPSFNYAPFDPVTAVLMDGRVAVIGAEDNDASLPPQCWRYLRSGGQHLDSSASAGFRRYLCARRNSEWWNLLVLHWRRPKRRAE